jgi:putative phosphonate metabolism protein
VSSSQRYAIYFVSAPDSALYRFGAAVIGYDCYSGGDVAHPSELTEHDWPALTDSPRHYGFHATLKAPFHLAESSAEAKLVSAVQSFAALGRSAPVFLPAVKELDGFIAIVPNGSSAALNALAADCTTLFDAFRAPMSAQERARRMASGLSQAELAHLDRWGYPYVLDRFRFHMTLTGRLPPERRASALMVLRTLFAQRCGGGPVTVDRLVILRQDTEQARFRVVEAVPLEVPS